MMKFSIKSLFGVVKPAWNGVQRYRQSKALNILRKHYPGQTNSGSWNTKRKLRSALKTLSGTHQFAIRNWYEGGFPFLTGDQSWLNQVVQDARWDQNFVTRRELMRRMRNHAQDVPIHKRGLDVSRQYVIGSHLPIVTCQAQSNDPDESGDTWCSRADVVWKELTNSIGINGESLYAQLTAAHDCKKNDGDILFVKVIKKIPLPGRSAGSTVEISAPALQMVEAHRIETPFDKWDREGIDIIDGVQFKVVQVTDPNGAKRNVQQKIGYWVKDTINSLSQSANYAFVSVEDSFFVYSPSRVNQVRGISDYYACETALHLLRDLLKMEMRAQEVQSDYTVFIKNATGQPIDNELLRQNGAPGVVVNADGTVNMERQKWASAFMQRWGGRVFAGQNGDDFENLGPCRPTEATQALWEFLINSYCVGARVPRLLIFPQLTKGQGTAVRAELDAANAGFISEFTLCWKPLFHWIWENFMGWRIQNDQRVADAPADWKSIEVSHARSVVVDIGYDSAATIAELNAGITNLHSIAQDLGTTRERLINQSVTDIALLKVACARIGKQFKVEVQAAEVRQSLSDVVKNMAAMKAAQAQQTAAENTSDDPDEELHTV